jgi:hypothetical protein
VPQQRAENKVLRHQSDAERPLGCPQWRAVPKVGWCCLLLSELLKLSICLLFSRAERQVQ